MNERAPRFDRSSFLDPLREIGCDNLVRISEGALHGQLLLPGLFYTRSAIRP